MEKKTLFFFVCEKTWFCCLLPTATPTPPHRPFKRQRMDESAPPASPRTCSPTNHHNATGEDKENQDANTPPGTVRPSAPDAMDTSNTAPLGQLRGEGRSPAPPTVGVPTMGPHAMGDGGDGGDAGSDRASCASDVGDVERMDDVAQLHDVEEDVQGPLVPGPVSADVPILEGFVEGEGPLLIEPPPFVIEGFVDLPADGPALLEVEPPAPSSPVHGHGRAFNMFERQGMNEEEEEEQGGGAFMIKRTSPQGETRFWSGVERNGPYFAIDWHKVDAGSVPVFSGVFLVHV